MSADNHHAPFHDSSNGKPAPGVPTAERGLPPVAPPSGRFIAQLFLIPGLIVSVLVLIWLAGNYLVAERRTPDYFLRNLDSTNEDIRWRAAHDLAQVLKREESVEMASDPTFALELADRLRQALASLKRDEQDTLERTKPMKEELDRKKEWNKLEGQRKHVLFLISALGDFTVPAGTRLLCDIAEDDTGADVKATTLRRRRAVWALANHGKNLKRFKELDQEKQEKILEQLKSEKAKEGKRGEWAEAAHAHLTRGLPLRVDASLEKCAKAEDSFLRTLVAHALNFWDGPLVEPTLVRLSLDDGHGTRLEITEED